jgi:hypothetical protein
MAGGTLIQIGDGSSQNGPFGIADTAGVYTYYPSLSAAVNAAVAGQVVEAFADYVETSNQVFLADKVDINLNGHSYTLDTVNSGSTLTNNSIGSCNIYNGKIRRLNGTDIFLDCTVKIDSVKFDIQFFGVTLENNNTITLSVTDTTDVSFSGNFKIVSSAPFTVPSVYAFDTVLDISNLTIFSDGECFLGVGLFGNITFNNCTMVSTGAGCIVCQTNLTLFNCKIDSSIGIGVTNNQSPVVIKNCLITTFSFLALLCSGEISDNKILSFSTDAVLLSSLTACRVINNVITSFQGRAIVGDFTTVFHRISGNFIESFAGSSIVISISGSTVLFISNNFITTTAVTVSNFHGILATRSGTTAFIITNNTFSHNVPSVSAFAIQATAGSLGLKLALNQIASGNLTPYGGNVIQEQLNTTDNYGNIQLN